MDPRFRGDDGVGRLRFYCRTRKIKRYKALQKSSLISIFKAFRLNHCAAQQQTRKKACNNDPAGNLAYRPARAIALAPQMLRIWPRWGRQRAQGSAGAEGLCG
jgi:hypothetical protein